MKCCSHYQKYKTEKICNLVKKKKNLKFCDQKADHKEEQSKDIYFCIECGHIACSKNSENGCMAKHFTNTHKKHKIIIHLTKFYIECMECNEDLEDLALEFEGQDLGDKLSDFCSSLKKTFFEIQQKENKKNGTKMVIHESETIKKGGEEVKGKLNFQPKSVFGLDNIGNTCFFNSVLQCLNGTPQLREFYLDQGNNDFQDEFKIYEQDDKNSNGDDGYTIKGFQDSYPDQYDQGGYQKKNKKNKKSKGGKQKDSDYYQQESSYQGNSGEGQPIKRINQQFQRLMIDGATKGKKSINPSSLYKNVSILFTRFMTFQQEDAQELLRCLLDSLSLGEEKWFSINRNFEKKTKIKKKMTFIENTFGGYLVNFLKCLECKKISRTFDFFMDLSVQIPGSRQMFKDNGKRQKRQNRRKQSDIDRQISKEEEVKEELQKDQQNEENYGQDDVYQIIDQEELKDCKIPDFNLKNDNLYEPSVYFQLDESVNKQGRMTSVEECLNEFASFELLNKSENYFNCEKCNKSNKALRKFYLYDPPAVLTIALKRFELGHDGLVKNCTKVTFNETLNIDPYTIIKREQDEDIDDEIFTGQKKLYNYELYGIVQHQGSLTSGHYISYVKHNIEGSSRWFQFNDEIVKETSFKNIQCVDAYLLFYKKIQ